MRRRIAASLVAGSLATVMVAAANSAPASAIANGSIAKGTPWVVQVHNLKKGTFATGVQINAHWVLTARHVARRGSRDFRGYISYSNNDYNPTDRARVDRVAVAPHGDIELLHLRRPSPLHHYAKLGLDYRIHHHGIAKILGLGGNAHGNLSKHLRQARVRRTGLGHDIFGGLAQKARPITGRTQDGDSGGPMIVNGRVIGLASLLVYPTGGERMYYTLLSLDKRWLNTRKHSHHR